MILTNEKQMVLTLTYYVFKMYQPHQDATYLPLDLICERRTVRDGRVVPMVGVSASRDASGKIHVSLANVDLGKEQNISLALGDYKIMQIGIRSTYGQDIPSTLYLSRPLK